jgi:hypothetical protein
LSMKALLRLGWLLVIVAFFSAGVGCATTDTESMAERPWNSPKNWEHGLPPSILEGR